MNQCCFNTKECKDVVVLLWFSKDSEVTAGLLVSFVGFFFFVLPGCIVVCPVGCVLEDGGH